ncbi:hypothetical protein M8391_14180, partial [Staphylococcus aureus]|nr:hypothetical protein [Staphylococcus aureus]
MASTAPPIRPDNRPPMDLTGKKSRQRSEEVIRYILIACSLVTIATTVGIVVVLLWEAFNFFSEIPIWDFLLGTTWTPLFTGSQQEFGVIPIVMGTLMTSLVAALIALPLGLA